MCDENRNEAPFTEEQNQQMIDNGICLLYTSDAADE